MPDSPAYPLRWSPRAGLVEIPASRLPMDLIYPRDVAIILELESQTLMTWRYLEKGPPFYRLGYRTLRYSRAEVLAFKAKYRNKFAPKEESNVA